MMDTCKDRIGTSPPRARTKVIYVDLGFGYFGSVLTTCNASESTVEPHTGVAHGERIPSTLGRACRGTPLIRKRLPLGPYCRPMPRVLPWS